MDLMLLACSVWSTRLSVNSLPGLSLCGGEGGCSLLPSAGSLMQTLHVEAHRFLRCCRGLQDVNQNLTEFLIGLTQDDSESKNNYIKNNGSRRDSFK